METQFKQSGKLIQINPFTMIGAIIIPKEWNCEPLENLFEFVKGKVPHNLSKESGTFPYLSSEYLAGENTEYTSDSDIILIRKNDLIMIADGSGSGRVYTGSEGALSSTFIKLKPKKMVDNSFIYYFLDSKYPLFQATKYGTSIPHVDKYILNKIQIPVTDNNEDKKIALYLRTIDELLKNTDKIITNNTKILHGLKIKLFTKGIDHFKYKTVNLGKRFLNMNIPESWDLKPFSEIVEIQDNYVELEDSTKYTRITVKRRHEGIVLRDIVTGKEILTKNQYKIRAGDFIISRRQIIHNACGLIPQEFDSAVVSNEYTTFSGTDHLDINYMDWFSQTDLFKKTIMVTTHGVDIEKYVFLLDEWLDLKMPLPKINEQKIIVQILSNMENRLNHEKKYRKKLKILKKGLMQKLLTGKIRVKI